MYLSINCDTKSTQLNNVIMLFTNHLLQDLTGSYMTKFLNLLLFVTITPPCWRQVFSVRFETQTSMLSKQTKSVLSRISQAYNASLTRCLSTIASKHQIAEYDAEMVVDCKNKLGECPMYVLIL